MRRVFGWAILLASVSASASAAYAKTETLSQDWRFVKATPDGAEREDFDDSKWRALSVPHDFSIEDGPGGKLPFDPNTPTGSASGYIPGGTGWYRKEITLTGDEAADIVLLRFEAVYMDADIWVNGAYVRHHNYGYTSFDANLTGKVKPGKNVVAVRVQHDDPSSRWYAGSGIIRPVTLIVRDQVHLGTHGPAITTPIADAMKGMVEVATPIHNWSAEQADVLLESVIYNPQGKQVATASQKVTIASASKVEATQSFKITAPELWSIETPQLYQLKQMITVENKPVDSQTQKFGIRTLSIDATKGILLNGRSVLLKGGNIHHDNYMLGGAGVPRADERKLELMKAAGYNSVRNAHNPASKATLETADRLGMLVINETFDAWAIPKMERDYARFFENDWKADTESMVLSARNHPSVIMWSIGNEIPEQNTPEGAARAKMQADFVRALDPSRPTTIIANSEGEKISPTFAAVDVAGYNYRPQFYESDAKKYPNRVIYGSESYSAAAFEYWRNVGKVPAIIGDFVWTSVDYLGEASIGWTGYSNGYLDLAPYPWHLAYTGEIDVTGYRRPQSYYREIMWKTGKNRIAAFVEFPGEGGALPDRDIFPKPAYREWVLPDVHPSWTWNGYEGKPLNVEVYSEFSEVELFLNGRSLGRKAMGYDTEYKARYTVKYMPGVLTAVGYENGKKSAEWKLETAGDPARVQLSVDRFKIDADGNDIAYVTAELVDALGRKVYAAEDDLALNFSVDGAGSLAGVGNGNPVKLESFTSGERTTFNGRAVGVIRAARNSGPITVTVKSKHLPDAKIQLSAAE